MPRDIDLREEQALVTATREEIGELVWTVLNDERGQSSWMWEDMTAEQKAEYTAFALTQLDTIRFLHQARRNREGPIRR